MLDFLLYVFRHLNFFPVRTARTKCPVPTLHPSRDSFNIDKTTNIAAMEADSGDYRASKKKVRVPINHASCPSLQIRLSDVTATAAW